jgi:ornithine cyclodeaminase
MSVKVLCKDEIEKIVAININLSKLMDCQKQAFIDFSKGIINTPLPLQILFTNPPGDCHVKAGFNQFDDVFIVKIATGFYQNRSMGLPAGDGAVLVFSKSTGLLQHILCDGGYLTQIRTAVAACIASQISPVSHICIVGTGSLGTLTQKCMRQLYPNAEINLWSRSLGTDLSSTLQKCDLVITTTASHTPLITLKNIKQNMHIIALGADETGKQELEPELFRHADHVIVDSRVQSALYGDSSYAISTNILTSEKTEELGELLAHDYATHGKFIITDLTGIAGQDIEMAKFVINNC